MSRREGGRGRGGGYYSSRGRGKKMRGGRGSCRIATAEEVEARNAELSRCAAGATSSSAEEEEEEGERGDTAAAGAAGSSRGAAKGSSSSSEDDSDNDNRERGGRGRGGKQMKFKRPLDFLRQQRKDAGEATDDSTSEDEDDLSTSMGKLKVNQGPQLTRREREAIEQQRRQRRYEKLHAEGKTPEAKADLARLAEVRRRREEAARLRAGGGN